MSATVTIFSEYSISLPSDTGPWRDALTGTLRDFLNWHDLIDTVLLQSILGENQQCWYLEYKL